MLILVACIAGPPALVAQWDVKKTARQNYQALGLMHKRPLSLKKSGGSEAALSLGQDEREGASESDGAGYTSSEEEDSATATPGAARPDSNATSKDIPKGFARIERDASGKILRVVMSAHDAVHGDDGSGATGSSRSATAAAKGKGRQVLQDSTMQQDEDEQEATPWGAPLNNPEDHQLFEEEPLSVPTDNPALRGAY